MFIFYFILECLLKAELRLFIKCLPTLTVGDPKSVKQWYLSIRTPSAMLEENSHFNSSFNGLSKLISSLKRSSLCVFAADLTHLKICDGFIAQLLVAIKEIVPTRTSMNSWPWTHKAMFNNLAELTSWNSTWHFWMDYHKDTRVYFIYGLFYSSAQIQTVNIHTWEPLKISNSAKMIAFWQNKIKTDFYRCWPCCWAIRHPSVIMSVRNQYRSVW